jgi:hypothetical protein
MDLQTAKAIVEFNRLADELAFHYGTTTPQERLRKAELREKAARLWREYSDAADTLAQLTPECFKYPYRGLDMEKVRPVFSTDWRKVYRRQMEELQNG